MVTKIFNINSSLKKDVNSFINHYKEPEWLLKYLT